MSRDHRDKIDNLIVKVSDKLNVVSRMHDWTKLVYPRQHLIQLRLWHSADLELRTITKRKHKSRSGVMLEEQGGGREKRTTLLIYLRAGISRKRSNRH